MISLRVELILGFIYMTAIANRISKIKTNFRKVKFCLEFIY